MTKIKKTNFENDSISLIKIILIIWSNKSYIIKVSLLFFTLSFFISITLKNKFKASSTFYSHIEDNNNNSSNLRNLAGLAGINIQTETSNNIPSSLYPKLINSPIFKSQILDHSIFFNNNEITFRDYLLNNSSYIDLSFINPIHLFLNIFNNDEIKKNENLNILKLSDQEYKLHKRLNNIIELNLNEKEGFIELFVEDYNPEVASQIAKIANEILQENIIEFKIKNINETYKFINNQLENAKNNFYELQDSLAIFRDKNKNIKSDLFLNQLSRIESEYNIAKNIYNELAVNKEKIAIEVKKNTPIFTVINPVVIPNEKFFPNRLLIIFTLTIFGFLLSSFWILYRNNFNKIISNFN